MNMMAGLLNHARRVAEEAMAGRAVTRQGTIDGYDPANFAVRVALQPDGTLTDWISLKTAWAGNGWGLFLAPSIGDVVEVDWQEADGDAGSAGWRFFNNQNRPLPVPTGEAWLVHASGAYVKLTTSGGLQLADGAGATITLAGGNITSAGTWTHTGSITASGEVTGNGIPLSTHDHSGVATGSGTSGGPVA